MHIKRYHQVYEKASIRQGENICKAYISQKPYYPLYIKNFQKSITKKDKQPEFLIEQIHKKVIEMDNKHVKMSSISLVIRTIQVKTKRNDISHSLEWLK